MLTENGKLSKESALTPGKNDLSQRAETKSEQEDVS